MDLIVEFIKAFWSLTSQMAPYLLFGLLLAGFLHEVIPDNWIKEHLGRRGISSVLKAVLFGIPLPLCSCSVIPFINSLKKKGANSGAVLAFTIATPITGIDSILATYGVLGLLFTALRVLASTVIALFAGILGLRFLELEEREEKSCGCCGCSCSVSSGEVKGFSVWGALSYGFKNILGDISKPLLYGLLLGALLTVLGKEYLGGFLGNYVLGYVSAMAIAVPMYVCATSSIPVAASLILAGAPAGASFVFLTAGPATNAVSISVVKEVLGKRALVIYLLSVVVGSLLFGILIDLSFLKFHVNPRDVVSFSETPNTLSQISAFLLLGLIGYHLLSRRK